MKTTGQDGFSIQAKMIRQFQIEYGNEPCFATPSAENCNKAKKEKCSWRHDCYFEAEERTDLNG